MLDGRVVDQYVQATVDAKRRFDHAFGFPVFADIADEGDHTTGRQRGRYLVEALGHCGACHTPRNFLAGPDFSRWLGGAPSLEGDGRVPNITPSRDGLESWSTADIAYYLKSGFTPDFDTVGGAMVDVQENLARLPDADREAIAAYLKAVPPVSDPAD